MLLDNILWKTISKFSLNYYILILATIFLYKFYYIVLFLCSSQFFSISSKSFCQMHALLHHFPVPLDILFIAFHKSLNVVGTLT